MVSISQLYNNIKAFLIIDYSDKEEDDTILLPDTIFNEINYNNGEVRIKE